MDTAAPKPDATAAVPAASAWTPFRHRAFALLWTATLVSNTGTWMHDVGAGWLMTTLSPSPAVVALVQSATTAPVFLFALFAGALADRIDRRRFLIVANAVVAVVVAAMAALTATGGMTPGLLLIFTLAIGAGAAFTAPAWQAIVPSLVPRESLQPALALNSMGINVSRAIGPALAGALIAGVGLAAPFAVNAASYLVIIAALLLWRPPPAPARTLPPEPIFAAMRTGLRHARRNDALKATLLRAFAFFVFASAFWALLPLVARGLPDGGAEIYGVMLALVGAGAVGGALLLPRLKRRAGANELAAAGTVLVALAMALFAVGQTAEVVLPAALLGGAGWIAVLTNLNVSAQTALPNWVRARGLAVMLMVFFGSMSAGAACWGQLAAATSIQAALIVAALGAVAAIPATWRARLGQGEMFDLAPALSWPAPMVAPDFDGRHDRGPVLVLIRYEIDPGDVVAFLAAARALSGERYRDGAYDWGVYQDAAEPRQWTEWFFTSSWAEHLRHHERATRHDMGAHGDVRTFHRGAEPPEARHLLAPAGAPTEGSSP